MDNGNEFGFWFPGCCYLAFLMVDFFFIFFFLGEGYFTELPISGMQFFFLSENSAASSFLIRKRKIKYKWHHPPLVDNKPFCGSSNGNISQLVILSFFFFCIYQKPHPHHRGLQMHCTPNLLVFPTWYVSIAGDCWKLPPVNALLAPADFGGEWKHSEAAELLIYS